MSNMLQSVLAQLQQQNLPYSVLSNEQSGRLLLLEKGARALFLCAAEGDESAFWLNPNALSSQENWNSGGDRTWISPELDYFIDGSGGYYIPAQLDPGNWKLAPLSSSQASMSMTCELAHASSATTMRLHLEKKYSLLPNPLLRNTSSQLMMNETIQYAGYEVHTAIQIKPTSERAATNSNSSLDAGRINLWSILQVPPGGEIWTPTFGSVQPLTMFSQTDQIPIKLQNNGFQVRCEGDSSFKLSVDAISSTGRFGYVRRIDDSTSSLIVRQFTVHPSGSYPDYPPHQRQYEGSCMQFYFDGGQLGHFAELEYHSPALSIDAPGGMTDASELHYFTGATESIRAIAQLMLGMPC